MFLFVSYLPPNSFIVRFFSLCSFNGDCSYLFSFSSSSCPNPLVSLFVRWICTVGGTFLAPPLQCKWVTELQKQWLICGKLQLRWPVGMEEPKKGWNLLVLLRSPSGDKIIWLPCSWKLPTLSSPKNIYCIGKVRTM